MLDHQPPISKWRTFWTSNPPIVIFILCLASFGLTTFSLSVYVAQTENIRNPNVLDWNRLLKHLSKLDYCLPKEPISEKQTNNIPQIVCNVTDFSSASLKITVTKDFSEAFYSSVNQKSEVENNQNHISAKGEIQVLHLGRGLPQPFLHDCIVIEFILPPKSEEICLNIKGPKGLLKYLESNETTCSSPNQDNHDIPLMVHSPDHKPVYWCEKNPKGKLVNFDLEIETNMEPEREVELTAFVNGPDKELIHLHLMVTSVFLFAILAAVIIAFLVRNVSPSTKKSLDSRGDHHMINMNSISLSSDE